MGDIVNDACEGAVLESLDSGTESVRHLSDAGITYRDGAEQRLLDIVGASSDRSSTSDELHWAATDWPTTYSLSRSRPNILRGFDIPATAKVLEIGCGCGPLTRYLGETCARVDAVEPVEVRAAVARARTADLASVEVFVGTIDDIPAEPVYDVVVVVGVLEYIGSGVAEAAPYVEFLRQCQERLVDGGVLILAIENALGVKYLAGSPEDHTDRVFDSLEGYPLGGHARVFSRAELLTLVETAGLTVDRSLGVFPDYKIPRALISDELFDRAVELAWRLPVFPSPDWQSPRPPLASEWRLWRTLAMAGLGPDTANSLVVLAAKGMPAMQLCRADWLATAWSSERSTGYAMQTTVRDDGSDVILDRRPIPRAGAGPDVVDPPRSWSEHFTAGQDVVELCSDDPSAVDKVLASWRDLLDDRASVPLDLVPHNLLVQADGSLALIDQEWPDADVERVRSRGAFLLASKLAGRSLPGAWPEPTIGALAERFRRSAGGVADPHAWTRFVEAEVELMARVIGPDTDEKRTGLRAELAEILDRPMPTAELADRHLDARDGQLPDLVSSLAAERSAIAAAQDELITIKRELSVREDELTIRQDELAAAGAQAAVLRVEVESERQRKQEWSTLAAEYEHAARASATLLGAVTQENERLAVQLLQTQTQFLSETQRASGAEAEVARLRADEASAGRRALASYRRTLDRAAPWGTHRKGVYLRVRAWSGGHKYVRPPVGPGPITVPPLLTSSQPLVSVVICVHGRWEYTARCLASIAAVRGRVPFEVIVVDDASPDDTAAQLTQVRGIRVVSLPANVGFLRAANAGMAARLGQHVLLLNNDTEVTEGWLDSLVQVLDEDPLAGVVGAQLVYPDGRLQEAGGIIFDNGSGWNVGRGDNPELPAYGYRREVDYCSGAAILVRDSVLASAGGGFDERFAPAYYEDTDLCFQARTAGFRVIYQPRSRVIHHEGVSHGTDENTGIKAHQVVNRDRFVEKWATELRQQAVHHESSVALAARSGNRPICLVIDHEIPKWDEDSGSLRMTSLLEILVKDGYDVTFLAHNRMDAPRHRRLLQDLGIEVLWGDVDPWAVLGRYADRLSAVVLSRAHLAWDYLPMVRRTAPNARLIYDTVDLHHVREERRAKLENNRAVLAVSAAIRELELSLIRSVDVTLVVSESEQDYLREITPDADVRVVSNVHRPRFPVTPREVRHGLLFVGGFRHPPNVDAVQWFVAEVFPLVRAQLPDVVIRIVGSSMPPEITELGSIDGIEILGWVSDLAPILDQSRVSVAPLRYGAGVKGKVVEAMVNGLPVVTTPAGAEGIADPADGALLIADDPESFAASVVRLYTDAALWEDTVSTARQLTVAKFGPAVVGQAWLEAVGKPATS